MEAQRIIITGGATRIGAAIAEKLSGPNKQIIIHYNKSKTKAENLKKNELKVLKNSDEYKKAITLFPDLEIVNVENLKDENND